MPVRTCVGCLKTAERRDLVRIVGTEDGPLVDERGTLPGRGVYLCPKKSCLEAALKKNAIGRSLRIGKADAVKGFLDKVNQR